MPIDIIVPTYNRPNDIEKFIFEIQKQNNHDYKVIIVDDCGTKPIDNFIPKDDNRFLFKKLEQNKGQAYARNIAIKMGTNKILVSLDDDAWFCSENPLQIIEQFFTSQKDLGCLMFNIITPDGKQEKYTKKLSDNQGIGGHITCGCAYRREAIEKIGGFNGFLHSYGEETDLTIKLINAGYKIKFTDKIDVYHNFQPGIRTDKWWYQLRYNNCRNDLMIVVMYFPLLYLIPYFLGKGLSHLKYSLVSDRKPIKTFFFTLAGFLSAILNIPLAFSKRKSMSIKDFKWWLDNRI